ncbi:hypothetical protein PVAR5_9051, partial [Paecilomyces variotii No. 5]
MILVELNPIFSPMTLKHMEWPALMVRDPNSIAAQTINFVMHCQMIIKFAETYPQKRPSAQYLKVFAVEADKVVHRLFDQGYERLATANLND